MDSKTLGRQVTEEIPMQHQGVLVTQIKKAEEMGPCVEALIF